MPDCPCVFEKEIAWPCVRHLIKVIRDPTTFNWATELQHVACIAGTAGAAFEGRAPVFADFSAGDVLDDDEIISRLEARDPGEGKSTRVTGLVDAVLLELLIQLVKRVIDRFFT